MTLHSCLPVQNKITVLATWAGDDANSRTAKATDAYQAARLAHHLARLSEAMGDVAAWLDVCDPAEAAVPVASTRAVADVPHGDSSLFDGCRHANTFTLPSRPRWLGRLA